MTQTVVASSEYRTVSEACGLLDRSERGKLSLTGSGAREFLQGQVTNDIESLAAGNGCYAAFLTPKGKMLGDLRVLATEAELLLDTERSTLQALFNLIRRFSVGYDVELHKRTLECGLLSLLGPGSFELAGIPELAGRDEHGHELVEIGGVSVRAIRTDMGLDLLCPSADTERLVAELERVGAAPVSESVAECLRVERGRPRYGLDLDDSVIPQEAGLNQRAVSFTKGCYVGQETVARLHYRGKPNRHLRGLKLQAEGHTGQVISSGEREVGHLGSVAESPRLGHIALALVRREVPLGSTVAVGAEAVGAQVVELPFA
ncbi:MAG TPA: glycine cleavage T C-terminal barrel domain-containing protein [Solirubrobacteraceae bacterium]|nr:glycine cleavage T C-terminal barrel domain-containing protein [Solirubrobacteraceae bacterium]